jgi:hypothetical protein
MFTKILSLLKPDLNRSDLIFYSNLDQTFYPDPVSDLAFIHIDSVVDPKLFALDPDLDSNPPRHSFSIVPVSF